MGVCGWGSVGVWECGGVGVWGCGSVGVWVVIPQPRWGWVFLVCPCPRERLPLVADPWAVIRNPFGVGGGVVVCIPNGDVDDRTRPEDRFPWKQAAATVPGPNGVLEHTGLAGGGPWSASDGRGRAPRLRLSADPRTPVARCGRGHYIRDHRPAWG